MKRDVGDFLDFLSAGFNRFMSLAEYALKLELKTESGKINYRLTLLATAAFAMMVGLKGIDWLVQLVRGPSEGSGGTSMGQLFATLVVAILLCVVIVSIPDIMRSRSRRERE